MEAQNVPSPTNALIVSTIIALRVIAPPPAVTAALSKAQGVMAVIGQRVCRESVLRFGQPRCSRHLTHTMLHLGLEQWAAIPSAAVRRCVVFVPDLGAVTASLKTARPAMTQIPKLAIIAVPIVRR